MAGQQLQIDHLPPQERYLQDQWAKQYLARSDIYPYGYNWITVDFGHNCQAGNHWVPKQLVAEGRGRFLLQKGKTRMGKGWFGPFSKKDDIIHSKLDYKKQAMMLPLQIGKWEAVPTPIAGLHYTPGFASDMLKQGAARDPRRR